VQKPCGATTVYTKKHVFRGRPPTEAWVNERTPRTHQIQTKLFNIGVLTQKLPPVCHQRYCMEICQHLRWHCQSVGVMERVAYERRRFSRTINKLAPSLSESFLVIIFRC
jgi:hypothetical protein